MSDSEEEVQQAGDYQEKYAQLVSHTVQVEKSNILLKKELGVREKELTAIKKELAAKEIELAATEKADFIDKVKQLEDCLLDWTTLYLKTTDIAKG
jgi:hypothetical protein